MNEVIETILERRSVRKYEEKQIPEEALQQILKAGNYAPSAMNQQPCRLTAVQNKEVIDKIIVACDTALGVKNNPFYGAPTIVISTSDESAIAPIQDGTLALANVMTAAESLGVSSCWIHIFARLFGTEEGKKIKNELGIPENHVFVGSCVLGYNPGEAPKAPAKKAENIVIIK